MKFNEVLKHFNEGLTQSEIAKIAGVSRQRIQQIQKKLGLPSIGQQKKSKYRNCERLGCENKINSCKSNKRKFCSRYCWTFKTEEQKLAIKNSFTENNRRNVREYYWKKRGMIPPEIPKGQYRVVIFPREKSSRETPRNEKRWTKNCYKCEKPILTHSKCPQCEKLIHFMEKCC